MIITDLNPEITKEQLEHHFDDNHTNIVQDSQLKGIWYLKYPDEASAIKATSTKYDTHIGEGEGSLVKWTLKAVTKESIRNNMLAEFQSFDNERKAKHADNKPISNQANNRPRMKSHNFPTMPASRNIEFQNQKFDNQNTVYSLEDLSRIFKNFVTKLEKDNKMNLETMPKEDFDNLFQKIPRVVLQSFEESKRQDDEFEDKEFIGLLQTTVLSGKKLKFNRDRAISNTDMVKFNIEQSNTAKIEKRLPSKSINEFNEFGL